MRGAIARPALLLLALVALAAASPVSAADGDRVGASPIDGRWAWAWTAAQLRRQGSNPYDLGTQTGPATVVFANGRYLARWQVSGRVAAGTYTVDGDVARFVVVKRDPHDDAGSVHYMRFRVFRDRLKWSMVSGREGFSALTIAPFRRVG
jgi:hypothetical protein